MKKVSILIFISLTLLMFGCKKDNPNSPDLKTQIVGKWNYLKNVNHSVVNGQSETETENDKPGNYFQFNADGSLAALLDDGGGTGTWKIENNKIRLIFPGAPEWETVLWDVQKITKNELVLYKKQIQGSDYYEATLYLAR